MPSRPIPALVRAVSGLLAILAVCGCAALPWPAAPVVPPDPVVYQTPEGGWCDELVSTCYVHTAIDASATRAHFGEPAVADAAARPDDFYLTEDGHLCDRRARACYSPETPDLAATGAEFDAAGSAALADRIDRDRR